MDNWYNGYWEPKKGHNRNPRKSIMNKSFNKRVFTRFIRMHLLKNRLMEKELAAQLLVTPHQLNNWMKGDCLPSSDKLAEISFVLKVKIIFDKGKLIIET